MTNEQPTPIGISSPISHSKPPQDRSPRSLQQSPQNNNNDDDTSFASDDHTPFFDSDDDTFGFAGLQASFSSDDDSTFERVDSDEESDWEDGSSQHHYDDDDEDDDEDEEPLTNAQPIPHWFAHEDPYHIEEIFKQYVAKLISPSEYMRSYQPFIGRIRRQASHIQGDFQTLDEVEICNCQRVKADSHLPPIKTLFVVTSWDKDGVPYSFFPLDTREQLHFWEQRIRDDIPASYLYCFPDWFNQAEASCTTFVYKSSTESLGVTYANVPWERTAYNCIARNNQLPLRSSSGEWDETFGSPPAF